MSTVKQPFLLSRSVTLLPEISSEYTYDERMEVNYSSENNTNTPVAVNGNSVPTQSKTFAAPGDDDPEREAENCY